MPHDIEDAAPTSQAPGRPAHAVHGPRGAATPTLSELFRVSLWLGLIGFGGGVSVLATIENVAVRHRRWLTDAEFAKVATVSQMLPGGAASNSLAAIGLQFRGVRGAAAAYVGFVLPGAVLITALAWVYERFGSVPHADALLAGLNAAVVGIIIAITLRMLRTGVSKPWQMMVAAAALLLTLVGEAGSLEVVFLGISSGLAWGLSVDRTRALRLRFRRDRSAPPVALPEEGRPLAPRKPEPPAEAAPDGPQAPQPPHAPHRGSLLLAGAAAPALWPALAGLATLAVVLFRTGLGAYGGGFAIIPSLHADMLRHGWLTERQFADAVAVGKLTPGPVLLMATFIGYLRAGVAGALVATVAILAAPFVLVVLMSGWLESMRSRPWMRAALRGLTPAVVGLMAAAALTLGQNIRSAGGVGIAAVVALTLIRFERINPVAMLALGGVARLGMHAIWGL